MAGTRDPRSWVSSTLGLYLVATAVFVLTVGIGILNGLDLVEFDRNVILGHVHSGTLGWITLGVVGTAFWVYQAADRRLAIALAVLTPVYVGAFLSGNFQVRAITGVVILAAVLWLFVWTWRTYLASERSLPGLAVALGLTTFTYGAVVGVVLQVQFAAGATWLSGDAIGAHAAAMVFAYLVLFAAGVIEWRLLETRGLPRAGVIELLALFLGGLILSVGLLSGAGQIAGGLYLLATLVAFVLFLVRIVPRALRMPWGAPGPARHIGAAALWVVVAVSIFIYLVAQFVTSNGDASAINPNILVASDHSTFIGVMTNLLFALVAILAPARSARSRWPNDLVFWGLNLGLLVFVVGLIANVAEVKRVGSPVMGLAILLGLGFLAADCWTALRRSGASDAAGTVVTGA